MLDLINMLSTLKQTALVTRWGQKDPNTLSCTLHSNWQPGRHRPYFCEFSLGPRNGRALYRWARWQAFVTCQCSPI